MNSNCEKETASRSIDVRYMQAPQIEKMKERYIQDAKERLPQYFSPEKRMMTEEMTIEDYQKEGLPIEILWRMVEYNLNAKEGISINRLHAIDEHIDYLASEYVIYHERIRCDFSDEEQKKQLQQLDEVFTRSVNRMTNFFIETVGKFMERNDVENESAVLKQSIKELYLRKIYVYAEFVRLEPDYARIVNTPDEWLMRDSYFMGDLLRLSVSKLYPQCIIMPPELYSEMELCIVGAIFQSANKWLITQKSTAVSEEQLGVELGLLAMKINVVLQKDSVSETLRSKLSTVYLSFYHYKVDDLNKRQKDAQENMYNRQSNLYGPLEDEIVLYWSKKLNQYIINKDVAGVFVEAIPQALSMYKQKVDHGSTLERYQPSNEWFTFYNESTTVTYEQSNSFNYKLRLNDWNHFIEKVDVDFSWQYYK